MQLPCFNVVFKLNQGIRCKNGLTFFAESTFPTSHMPLPNSKFTIHN